MTTNSIYSRILAEMPEGIEKAIMLILATHIGSENRITKQTLYFQVARQIPALRTARNNTVDRQVRQAIENLRLAGYPVLSDSGNGGYWLGRRGEVAEFVSELESRQASLSAVIRSLRSSNKAAWIDPPKPPVQTSLW